MVYLTYLLFQRQIDEPWTKIMMSYATLLYRYERFFKALKLEKIYELEGLSGIAVRCVSKALRINAMFIDRLSNKIECGASLRRGLVSKFLSRNEIFRNCHKNQRCFVIGNGPSIKSQDLSYLHNEITFVMNAFWKHPIINLWQPDYYFLAAPIFFDGSEDSYEFLVELRTRVAKLKLFVPMYPMYPIKNEIHHIFDDQLYSVALSGSLAHGLSRWPDFTKAVPGVQSVSQFAIMAAMFMGCSPIYLIGFDHDWLSHRTLDKHFYEGNILDKHFEMHGGDLSKFSYKNNAIAIVNLWNGYEALRDVAQSRSTTILNATAGGFLDVFERVKYEDVLCIPV